MTDLIRYRMLINGEWVGAEDGKTFASVNPTNQRAWAEIPEATADDVSRAVEAAHSAFTEGPWASFTPTERGRRLRKLADLLAEKSEELGRIESIDTGKLLKETRWQAKYIAEFFHYYAGCADKIHGETLPIDKPDMLVFTSRDPLGVVAAVVPWNSQLFLVAVKIGPALAAGNTVVLKASEHASAAMLEFGDLRIEATKRLVCEQPASNATTTVAIAICFARLVTILLRICRQFMSLYRTPLRNVYPKMRARELSGGDQFHRTFMGLYALEHH